MIYRCDWGNISGAMGLVYLWRVLREIVPRPLRSLFRATTAPRPSTNNFQGISPWAKCRAYQVDRHVCYKFLGLSIQATTPP